MYAGYKLKRGTETADQPRSSCLPEFGHLPPGRPPVGRGFARWKTYFRRSYWTDWLIEEQSKYFSLPFIIILETLTFFHGRLQTSKPEKRDTLQELTQPQVTIRQLSIHRYFSEFLVYGCPPCWNLETSSAVVVFLLPYCLFHLIRVFNFVT